jgi:hypothetical protein
VFPGFELSQIWIHVPNRYLCKKEKTDQAKKEIEMHRYMGMVNFIRNHIPQLSKHILILTELLKNTGKRSKSNKEQEKTHVLSDKKIKEIKGLAHHNEDKQLLLWTDASKGAIGEMICQGKPKRINLTDDLVNRVRKLEELVEPIGFFWQG